jgi:3-oxoadipate enol-lactonase
MWENQKSFFSEYPVYCPNLLGTDSTLTLPFTLDEMAISVVQEILSKQTQIILCGLSMGGYIAQRILEIHPQNIKGMILISTRSSADSNEAKQKRIQAIQSIKSHGKDLFLESFCKNMVSQYTRKNSNLLEEIQKMASRNTEIGILYQLLALMGRIDSTAFLPQISIPTLILSGSEDSLTPAPEMKSIFSSISHSEFLIIENSGHLSPLENPSAVNQAILQFLTKHF